MTSKMSMRSNDSAVSGWSSSTSDLTSEAIVSIDSVEDKMAVKIVNHRLELGQTHVILRIGNIKLKGALVTFGGAKN